MAFREAASCKYVALQRDTAFWHRKRPSFKTCEISQIAIAVAFVRKAELSDVHSNEDGQILILFGSRQLSQSWYRERGHIFRNVECSRNGQSTGHFTGYT